MSARIPPGRWVVHLALEHFNAIKGGKQVMSTPKAVCRTVLVLVLPLVAAAAAHATTITTTRSFDASDWLPSGAYFPKFDASLGVLNSIRFTLASEYYGDFDMSGGGFLGPGETLEVIGHHEARGTARIMPLGGPPQFGFSFVMPGDLSCSVTNTGQTWDFFACESLNYGGGSYDDLFLVDPLDHGLFITGSPFENFNVSISADRDATCTASVGGCGLVSEFRWIGSLTLQYTFGEEPPPGIPEPGSLLVLGLGLVGLRLVRRRRH